MKYSLKNSIAYRITRAANNIHKTINNKLSPFGIAIEQRATLEMIKFEENEKVEYSFSCSSSLYSFYE